MNNRSLEFSKICVTERVFASKYFITKKLATKRFCVTVTQFLVLRNRINVLTPTSYKAVTQVTLEKGIMYVKRKMQENLKL